MQEWLAKPCELIRTARLIHDVRHILRPPFILAFLFGAIFYLALFHLANRVSSGLQTPTAGLNEVAQSFASRGALETLAATLSISMELTTAQEPAAVSSARSKDLGRLDGQPVCVPLFALRIAAGGAPRWRNSGGRLNLHSCRHR